MKNALSQKLLVLTLTAGGVMAWNGGAQAASFTGLGDLPGGSVMSYATGVSGDGSAVVGYGTTSASYYEAFRWTSGGGMVRLDVLPDGGLMSSAHDVSGDGSVVVGSGLSEDSVNEAYRWTSGGGVVRLGDLPGGRFESIANGVSGDGSVVVGDSISASGQEAFRWTSGGGMVGLGDLPGGSFYSIALGVSGDGSTIVGYSYTASNYEAYRWTSGGGMVGLGDLPGGSFQSQAYGVSGDGSVVVGWGNSASGFEAFRWTSGGGMVGLGDLPGGIFYSDARAVSEDGSVVVGRGSSASGNEAFIWDLANGMQSLKTVLENEGVDMTGWILTAATSVSSDGRYVVGYGDHNGVTEAFLALVHEPPAIITQQPQPQTVNAGGTANFSVTATAANPLTYQWLKDGIALPGATNTSLLLTNVQPARIGDYTVVVSNGGGSVTSGVASLTIPGIESGIWKGMVAYYPFNGNANDESGQGNNGIPSGAVLAPNRFQTAGAAYSFNGNSYIEVPNSAAFKSKAFTIAMWFNAGLFPNSGGLGEAEFLISKGTYNFELHLGSGLHGNTGIRFLPRNVAHWDAPPGSYSTNNWHHMVAVYDPDFSKVQIYIDSMPKELSGPVSYPSPPDNTANARLGMRHDGTYPLVGKLDDVRIYNRALSSNEVAQLYATEFPDADKDGLSDYDETNLLGTNPNVRDTDGDGLNDYQEVRVHNTNPTLADSDGDGFNDYAEIYSAHDPLLNTDFPAANLSAFTAIEIEFITKTGTTYQLQASPDLVTWTNFDNTIPGDGNIWKKTYPTRSQGRLFHRVELAP